MRKNLGEMDSAFFKEVIEENLSGRTLDLFRCGLDVTVGPPWDGTQLGSECINDLVEAIFAEVDPSSRSDASVRGKKWLLRVKLDKLRLNRLTPNRMSIVGNIGLPPPGLANQHLLHQAAISRPKRHMYQLCYLQAEVDQTQGTRRRID
jgi:hypothetical protein